MSSETVLINGVEEASQQPCHVLNELRLNRQLCDAVIRVEGGFFPVHRAIMSACSPYFRALFTNGMYETDQKEVFIPNVTADMMSVIVEYAYTGSTNVTHDNVERILPAADQFHVLGLVKTCCEFLSANINNDNCIGIRNFARQYYCSTLEKISHKHFLENFTSIATKSNEILNLSSEEMVEVLSSDQLNVKNEEVVFDSLLRWISHDVETRKNATLSLLTCVRLGLLSTQYFVETVKVHPYIRDNEDCRPLVIETLKFLYDLDMEGSKEMDLTHPLARPRVPRDILFVLGGWSGGSPTNVLETYDSRADRWRKLDVCDKGPRAYHGCASVDGMIYVVGGFDGMEYFNSVRRFDPVAKTWTEVAPMNSKRCYVSVTVLDGQIYALGGFDGHLRLNTVERYTPKDNQWTMVAPMHQQRSDASATSIQGQLYICGGFNGQECLNSAERYDPATNQWSLITPMRNRRSGVGVTSHDGHIYAIGGFNGITRMNNGERFNPQTNTWSTIAEMYSPRSNFAIEVLDDMVFTIGGFNGVTTIYNVECYDATSDEWYDCTDMTIFRSALSTCVARGLPNVQDYILKDRIRSEDKKKKNQA